MTTTDQNQPDPRKLAEDARAWIVDLAAGRRQWRMCIPPQPDDTDIVLIGMYKALLAALDEVERLKTAIDRFQATEGIIIGKRYFEKVKLPIPISAAVNVEGDLRLGEFTCSVNYNDGPPEKDIDYTKNGRSFKCGYCPITLSTQWGIEEHIEKNHVR